VPPLLLRPVPPVFDIVMSSELLMVPPLLEMPLPPEFDIVMVPELLMMAPERLLMPLLAEF